MTSHLNNAFGKKVSVEILLIFLACNLSCGLAFAGKADTNCGYGDLPSCAWKCGSFYSPCDPPLNNGTIGTDPFTYLGYQNELIDTKIKEHFLRRLAWADWDPINDFPIVADTRNFSDGEYLYTTDDDELEDLFQKIANKILLQIVE